MLSMAPRVAIRPAAVSNSTTMHAGADPRWAPPARRRCVSRDAAMRRQPLGRLSPVWGVGPERVEFRGHLDTYVT